MSSYSTELQREEQRIADVYRERAASGVDARYTFSSPGNLAIIQERERAILKLLRKSGRSDLTSQKLLEIGCGRGFWLRQFVHWGMPPENLTGVDLLPEHVEQARALVPPSLRVLHGSGAALPFADGSFDIVLQSVVFSSILDPQARRQVAREMLRVLRPAGVILWYDFFVDNPRNPDVRGVPKKEIHDLFGGCDVRLERLTVAPPLARIITPVFAPLYEIASATRILCTHYLGLITKK